MALVSMHGITKSFYGVLANDRVDFAVEGGEIHALLGENGAGKSTLMNVLTGLYQPEEGEIRIEGHPRRLDRPASAIAAGIGMVHQHFRLVRNFTVAENLHLGWSETPARLARGALERRSAELARQFGLSVPPSALVRDLSAGEQQRVEILRVLARGARVLILDEPTAVLTPQEVVSLFAALRAFRAEGGAVILISHKLGEVLEIADRVTVMRAGRHVATRPALGATRGELARLIMGAADLGAAGTGGAAGETAQHRPSRAPVSLDPGAGQPAASPVSGAGRPAASLSGVVLRDARGIALLDGVDLEIRAGEILGVAGIAGNGQRALSEVLTGCAMPQSGEVRIAGQHFADPLAALRLGVGHIPEDRLRSALAGELSLAENAILRDYRAAPVSRGWRFSPREARALAGRIIAAAGVDRGDPALAARSLSGGNQQRLVAEREMRVAGRLLVAVYPTRGLDVGATRALHGRMQALRATGSAVLLVSEEIEELLEQADRIAVMFRGRITGILPAAEADAERLGLLMSGVEPEADEEAAWAGQHEQATASNPP